MMDLAESDVTSEGLAPTSDTGESSPAVASPGNEIGSEAPVVAEATPVVETVASEPAGETATPFELPEDDSDLMGQETNPHVKGLIQVRQQLRADRQAHQAAITPWTALEQQYGSREDVQRNLNVIDGLFEEANSTNPFIDRLVEMTPSTVPQLIDDLMRREVPGTTGVFGYQAVLKALSLDPNRLDDYKAITNGTYAIPSAIDPDHLAKINEPYHAAFKALNPVIREKWETYDDDEKTAFLEDKQEKLETSRVQQELLAKDQQRDAEARTQAQQAIQTAQVEAVKTIRSEDYGWIKDELRKQWTPSGDPKISAGSIVSVMGTVTALALEPDIRELFTGELAEAGIQVDFAALDAAIAKVQTRSDDRVAAEKSGETEKARRAGVDVNNARRQIKTLLGSVATALAGVRGGVLNEVRNTANGAIDTATAARPGISGGQATIPTASQTRYRGEGPVPKNIWTEIGAATRKTVPA